MYKPDINRLRSLDCRLGWLLIALSVVIPGLSSIAAKPNQERYRPSDFMLKCEMQKSTLYESEPVELDIVLYSPTPDIAGVSEISPVSLKSGEFSFFSKVRNAGGQSVVDIKGERYYRFVVESYIVSMARSGKFSVVGPELEVTVSYPVVVRDPFWGRVQTVENVSFPLEADKCDFKVKDLPRVPKNTVYSGAVGDFTITTDVPPGNIIVNEEATAYVTISGEGWLPDSMLPEYRDAFKTGMKLKSISEERNRYVKDGKLVSELRLECTFIPLQREGVEIGEVSFEFFNPNTGKYQTVSSAPVGVTVKSSTVKREMHPV